MLTMLIHSLVANISEMCETDYKLVGFTTVDTKYYIQLPRKSEINRYCKHCFIEDTNNLYLQC